MAYSVTNSKGVVYYLHTKTVTLNGGRQQPIYFFAKDVREAYVVDRLPEGYAVSEQKRSGLPIVHKVKAGV